jgi:hypothetical protein
MHPPSDVADAPRPSRIRRGMPDPVSRWLAWTIDHRARVLVCIAAVAIVSGTALHLAGSGTVGDDAWAVAVALLAAELSVEVVRAVLVDRQMGVDTIALVAMIGALALGQELAVS